MENARVYFAKEFMPDDVRRMYLILKKGCRAEEEMGYGGRAYELVCEE